MKIILFVSVLTILTIGCSKKDEPAVQMTTDSTMRPEGPPPIPEPAKPMSYDMLPPHMRAGIAAIDRNKLHTHASAAKIYIDLPDEYLPVPIPPPLRPFRDLQLKNATDSTALYTFKATNGRSGDMLLQRIIGEKDTIWIPMHILPH